jgi:plasmid stability protein
MANLQVKDLPDDLHAELKRRAARRGLSIRDHVLDLIKRDLATPSVEDWLDAVRRLEPVALDQPAAEVVRESRREADRGDRRR